MQKRKHRRFVRLNSDEHQDTPTNTEACTVRQRRSPEEIAANSELRQLIEQAIELLPEDFRAVFVLPGLEQLSVQETAALLDLPTGTVKTRYHRAKHIMQRHLKQFINEAGLEVFEFAGARCDRMVERVMTRVRARNPVDRGLQH